MTKLLEGSRIKILNVLGGEIEDDDRGRGQGKCLVKHDEDEADPNHAGDKSIERCYNCQGMWHFANECRKLRKERPMNDGHEKAIR